MVISTSFTSKKIGKEAFLIMVMFLVGHLFAQKKEITTQFSQDGNLYANFNDFETVLANFKTDETCTVLAFQGRDIYKIKYNNRVGFVDSQFLIVNEEMTDLFYAYQNSESTKTIEAENKRKEKVLNIEKENEKKQQLLLKELEAKDISSSATKTHTDSTALLVENPTKLSPTEHEVKNEIANKETSPSSPLKTSTTCNYAINEFDPIDKVKLIRTEPFTIAENVTVEFFKSGKNRSIFFNLFEDLGCASYLPNNRSFVKVVLENNKTITFYHTWDMYCGEFIFKATLSSSQMGLLKKAPIKSLVFHGTKSSKEITTITYKTFFIDKIACIE